MSDPTPIDWKGILSGTPGDVLKLTLALFTLLVVFDAGFWFLAAVFALAVAMFTQVRAPMQPQPEPDTARKARLQQAALYAGVNLLTVFAAYGVATILGAALRGAAAKIMGLL
ncbi:hypothetical protein RGUI_2310 [Rhodovulum sp. P5]|uniref:hypothetical protein n=1 Tax=Rhodovulum sp. P5 TaxID=1564506 RepID=UPI0009C3B98A|nr:hypothetical protein [Rhodovulum sp. P5]ARE40451.1 hypothetical protein RGUI_2310 [Rhodovulum sp. P5]